MDLSEYLITNADQLGIQAEIIQQTPRVVRLSRDGKNRYLWGSVFPLNNSVATRITKYKALTKEILENLGIETPRGFVVQSLEEVVEGVKSGHVSYPVVVKPNDAALGSRVFVKLINEEELTQATLNVLDSYDAVLVEEYIPYDDHRVLVIDGKIIAACKRQHPYIVGDGEKKLEDLIIDYNASRGKKPLIIDDEVIRYVGNQGLKLETVVEKDKKVILRGNANIQTGGIVEDVTEKVAPKYREMVLKITNELNMRLAGVDILTPDIGDNESPYVVTEINGLPSFDIHLNPTIGQVRDPRPALIEAIFRDII